MMSNKKFLYTAIFSGLLTITSTVLLAEKPPVIKLTATTFADLPGWSDANLLPSITALRESCKIVLAHDETVSHSTTFLPLTDSNWMPICQSLQQSNITTNEQADRFLKTWFTPYTINSNNKTKGLFTGYYLPAIPASWHRTNTYNVPIYGRPSDLITVKLGLFDQELQGKKISGKLKGGRLYPYDMTREQIDAGALEDKAPIILWTKTRADRFFLQIQGSGVANLPDGSTVWLGYDGDNGGKYYPIGRWFIEHGVMDKKDISMQKIYQWLLAHPKQADQLMNLDQSFVFFTTLENKAALGSEKSALTPGYSLAIDNAYIPFALPLWLTTMTPNSVQPKQLDTFNRLMIAQDTGGAIKGPIRGDIFFGTGDDAAIKAGYMKNSGRYWLLIPNSFQGVNANSPVK